jgi:hypothetical protein
MPKVHRIRLELQTGARGHEEPVVFSFNSHDLPLRVLEGGPGAGQTLVGEFEPQSVAHSVTLLGPSTGVWDVQHLSVTYSAGADEWTVRFEPFELDPQTAADIWEPPPLPTWDV